MKLVPTDPPGRSSRRARRYAQDMRVLRGQGYTFEAIRMALAAVGVHVSNATVQREIARAAKGTVVVKEAETFREPAVNAESDLRSGKEIAEAFTATRNAKPLFLNRSPE